MEAALSLIAEKGAAGVSAAAPYRHCRNRDALLTGVARLGFERFGDMISKACNDVQPSAEVAFTNLGRTYLASAYQASPFFTATVESGLSHAQYPELREAGDRAFAVLTEACEAVPQSIPVKIRPPAMMMALHIWSLSHGIASLFARGDRARRPTPMEPEDILEAAFPVYMVGLNNVR